MPEESIQEVLPVPPGLSPALNLEFPGIATPHLPPWPLCKSEGHPLFPRLWRLLYSSDGVEVTLTSQGLVFSPIVVNKAPSILPFTREPGT